MMRNKLYSVLLPHFKSLRPSVQEQRQQVQHRYSLVKSEINQLSEDLFDAEGIYKLELAEVE